jgi:biopolymer transport protein ExbB/TolQ
MNPLELFLYELSTLFMTPVLVVLCAMFAYAVFALGSLGYDLVALSLSGKRHTPLLSHAASRPTCVQEDLELLMLKRLEPLRITSRVAPMLGLVATMIPMGPALIAVANGDSVGMAEQLVIAFAAVIVALLSAALTYVVLLVRRRWLLAEIHAWLSGTAMRQDAALARVAEDARS